MEPTSWQEIDAWARQTKTTLNAYESLFIKKLSGIYAMNFNRSNGLCVPSPLQKNDENMDKVEARFKNFFALLRGG